MRLPITITTLFFALMLISLSSAWRLQTYKKINFIDENPRLEGTVAGDNCHPVPYAHKSFKWTRTSWIPCFFNAYSTSNCVESSHIGDASENWANPAASGRMKGFKYNC